MDGVRRGVTMLLLTATWAITPAAAQTTGPGIELSVGAGWGALTDDETNLGKGVPLSGGIATVVAGRLRLGAEVDWMDHTRDSGYLRAEGNLTNVFGTATYLFGTPGASVRPTVGAGLGIMHSTGTLIGRSIVAGPGGLPVSGPDTRAPWSLTRGAFDLRGGVRMALSDRVALRPEGRFRATFGSGASRGIEPPLLLSQVLVHVDIALGRR